jgi:hypothetical protein
MNTKTIGKLNPNLLAMFNTPVTSEEPQETSTKARRKLDPKLVAVFGEQVPIVKPPSTLSFPVVTPISPSSIAIIEEPLLAMAEVYPISPASFNSDPDVMVRIRQHEEFKRMAVVEQLNELLDNYFSAVESLREHQLLSSNRSKNCQFNSNLSMPKSSIYKY